MPQGVVGAKRLRTTDPRQVPSPSRVFVSSCHVVEGTAWLFEFEPSIEVYLNPPRSVDELRQTVSDPKKGYDIHHIVEKTSAEQDGFPTSMIHSPENLVRIPRYKHWEISSWYMTKSWALGDLSPRDYLRSRDWNQRIRSVQER